MGATFILVKNDVFLNMLMNNPFNIAWQGRNPNMLQVVLTLAVLASSAVPPLEPQPAPAQVQNDSDRSFFPKDFDMSTLVAPFGIRMGLKKEQLHVKKELAPLTFGLVDVPKPHPDFETYVVEISPNSGVCFVKAISKDVVTSVYGTELKIKFGELRSQIETVYGKSNLMEMLRSGSIWRESNEYMMGLLKKERILAASWESKSGASMKAGLAQAFLGASALSQEKGYFSLEYYFDNQSQCETEIKAKKSSVF
jgi:hypothetical protein